jgi:hypothetical protein
MANELANLRTRLAQVASRDLSTEHRTAMQALLQLAIDKLTGARAVADHLERKGTRWNNGRPTLAGRPPPPLPRPEIESSGIQLSP